ncbi:hypothetical protein HD806DRAFT_395974 [Xylariaceae sp. AK1471]|nr:hypothetical protein HD806DRAFT_395974 [Xylariaceae sp. AK1471]
MSSLPQFSIGRLAMGFRLIANSSQNLAKKFGRLTRLADEPWLWEYTLWILSTTLLGCQIAVLFAYSGSPLPDWPFGITFNALISTLSAISSSSLIAVVSNIMGQQKWVRLSRGKQTLSDINKLEEASRGPWGSLVLLFRAREWDISVVGALGTILSLATTTFIQQTTSIKLMPHNTDTPLITARFLYHNDFQDSSGGYNSLSDTMVSRFHEGLYYTGSTQDESLKPPTYCFTSNCTYQIYESLAVCSSCADISSHATTNFERNEKNASYLWALPNGFNISLEKSFVDVTPAGKLPPQLAVESKYDPVVLTAGLPILNLTAIMPCIKDNQDACNARACECMLYWCVNKYNSTVIQGSLHEDILATAKFGKEINVPDISYKQEGQPYYGLPPTDHYPPTPESYKLIQLTNSSFLVGPRATSYITNFTAQALRGSVYNSNSFAPLSTNEGVARIYASYSVDNVQGLKTVFENIAASMTSGLRSRYRMKNTNEGWVHGVYGVRDIRGTGTILIPLVQVSWPWITLPVILQLTTFVMLCSAHIYSSYQNVPLWKSSAIATVFLGAKTRQLVEMEIPKDLAEIERAIEQIEIGDPFLEFRNPM